MFDKCINAEMDDYLAEHINDIRNTESDKRGDLIQNIPLSKVWGEVDVSGVSRLRQGSKPIFCSLQQ